MLHRAFRPVLCFALLGLLPLSTLAEGVRYHDFAAEPDSGVVYQSTMPPRHALLDGLRESGFRFPDDLPRVPHKPNGSPGVALLDFDRDGDLDIYVTNSAGSANSLFANQLADSGSLGFVDVAAEARVAAADHDSSGVCFGDIDNDGDHDLMVLGAIMPNRLFENQGDGTFTDITAQAGVGGGDLSTASCTLGDVDGDGLLDIAVANTHTSWNDQFGIVVPYVFSEHNQLFVNQGGNVFADVSAASGVETLAGFAPEHAGSASLTWALALVDYDLDGDVDLFTLDDQGGVPDPVFAGDDGTPYGLIHLHENDGTGHFVDRTVEAGLAIPGNWMGVDFGDLNCDGVLDFFATNAGDYAPAGGPPMFPLGARASRWYFGNADGSFSSPGVGDDLVATVFGWGTSIFDYDNDGDSDIVYHGGIDLGVFAHTGNPGVVLENSGCGHFTYDQQALEEGSDYGRRVGQGLATGDLDGDGLVDIVNVSNSDFDEGVPRFQQDVLLGSPFDDSAFYYPLFFPADPADPTFLVWSGLEGGPGSLAVEVASSENDQGWAEVHLRGSVGEITDGRVNRDGIGAVVRFETPGGKSQMRPVLGGASFASQNSLAAYFGMGQESYGTVEVLWPGGVRNRLRGVTAGERILFPEIPCDIADERVDRRGYIACVKRAIGELVEIGVLDPEQGRRFFDSAFECQGGPHTLCLGDRRYQVEVEWTDFSGTGGTGWVVPFDSASTGLFAFFGEQVEIHAEILDGCAFNDHFWFFAAASTNVAYTLTVTDTESGMIRSWENPLGQPAVAITDTRAFATCP